MATAEITANVPPQNLEAERSVLGAMMVSAASLDPVFADVRLATGDFYRERHRVVYEAIKALYERDEAIDALTVTEILTQTGQLEAAGGRAEVQSLPDQVPAPGNARHYAAIVKQNALLRRLLAAAQEIQRSVHGHEGEPQQLAEQAERLLFEAAHREQAGDFRHLGDVLVDEVERLEKLASGDASVTGTPSGFIDLDSITGGFQPGNLIVVAARPGMGKCVGASTLVYDPTTGARTMVGDLVRRVERGDDGWVASLDSDLKLVPARVSAAYRNGRKAVHRLTTRLGRVIEATPNHPLLAIAGWTELSQLRPGDRVAVPRLLPRPSEPAEMPDHEIVMLAALVADGHIGTETPVFCFDGRGTPLVEEVRDAARGFGLRFGGTHARRATISAGRGGGRDPVRALCERHGIWGKLAESKFVPDAIFSLPEEEVARFLRILYACDGHIYAGAAYNQIGYTTVSRRLAHDVQHLLLRFGIVAAIRRMKRPVYDGTGKCEYEVRITDRESLIAFCHRIGAVGKERQASSMIAALAGTVRNTNVDTVPAETNWHLGTRGISRERLGEIAAGLEDPRLQELATSDLWWDEVASVEPIGEEETFDLNVPVHHNFVADDVVVHNSGMVINVADHVAREKRRAVALFSLEMSEMEIAQRMVASRSRIPGDKLRKGQVAKQDWTRVLRAGNELEKARLWIDDSSDLGLLDLRAKARRLHASESAGDGEGLAVVIVDYLQLMRADDPRANRVEQVGQMSRGLKILARELGVPVIALSQLSRAPEQRPGGDKRPILSDLRESGCLTGDTRVFLPESGGYRAIRELVGEHEFDVQALNPKTWRLERRRASRVFPTGRKAVFELRTGLGREIRATANHRFLTIDGWKRLDQLTPGTHLTVPRTLPTGRGPTVSPDELALGQTAVKPAMAATGVTTRALHAGIDTAYCGSSLDERNLGRERAARVAEVVDSDQLRSLATSDVYWDQVRSVEADGTEDVFDLTVPGLHNFVADDIVVHNSIEQDSDLVVFIYRDEYYDPESEDAGIAELIVRKNRHGPTDTVRLAFKEPFASFSNLAREDRRTSRRSEESEPPLMDVAEDG